MARTIEGLLDKIYFTSGSEAEKGASVFPSRLRSSDGCIDNITDEALARFHTA